MEAFFSLINTYEDGDTTVILYKVATKLMNPTKMMIQLIYRSWRCTFCVNNTVDDSILSGTSCSISHQACMISILLIIFASQWYI